MEISVCRKLNRLTARTNSNRASPLFWQGYQLVSSLVASRAQHRDMLEFAAAQGVNPQVELYDHEGATTVTTILDRMEANKVRYRAVMVTKP
jgi:D-arabinose 1-dehydrogenase-like Zn-dependent alcohol dehydrogenase